jgi:hypothetical protein
MMSPAADSFFFLNSLLGTQEVLTNVRQNFISPTGDEFTLINHEDVTRVQHLNVARNKRRSVSAGYKHGTPKLFTGQSSSEALKKGEIIGWHL